MEEQVAVLEQLADSGQIPQEVHDTLLASLLTSQ
jgi:hypothetical protein